MIPISFKKHFWIMPVFILNDSPHFPDVHLSEKDGLLAVGGDLSKKRLINAYLNGIFPWYNPNEPILWWSPDPRLVLFPHELRVSKRLKRTIKQKRFKITFNQAFKKVMEECANVRLEKGEGTWINEDMVNAYCSLFYEGFCVSAEAWEGHELVGGLYGVLLGKVLFGESMFSRKRDASKVAFVSLISHLKEKGLKLIDCQVETSHLKNFGARMIPRDEFLKYLRKWCHPLRQMEI